jgi:hypothetical protein
MVKNRKEIEKLIFDTFDALDPSGTNTAKYTELYGSMSDAEFEKHMKSFLGNDQENFILDINEYDRNVTMDRCEAAAKVLGIPLEEYVFLPHLSMDKKNVVATKEKALVGWVNIKRTQQLLHKKNGLATSDTQINHLTGQVTGDDKDARDSDIEATMLVSLGAEHVLQELHGPRADDVVMRRQMMADIASKGYVLLEDLENLPTNKTTLNTVNAFLLAMGIKSDLVTDSYILPKILDELL